MTDLIVGLLPLLPLESLVPLQPVHPSGSNGFAASIVAAFLAVGLLILVAKFATTKPRNRRRPRR